MLRILAAVQLTLMLCGCESRTGVGSLADALPVNRELNVLIVSFDALRADALGLYGYPRPMSPNLDRFAEEALVFDHADTAAPVTPTSFAAAFTGQLPFRVFSDWRLVDTKTLAGAFTDAGFATFALLNNFEVEDEVELKRIRDLYDGEIFFGDYLFGELYRFLEEQGLLDNTPVVVTTDHGEEFMEHGQVQHNGQYEELVRIPLLIRDPNRVRPARTNAPHLDTDLCRLWRVSPELKRPRSRTEWI